MRKFFIGFGIWVSSLLAKPKEVKACSRPSLIDLDYFSRMTGIHHFTLIELVLQFWGCSEKQLDWSTVTPDNMHFYLEECEKIAMSSYQSDGVMKDVYFTVLEKHMGLGRPCLLTAVKRTMLELYPDEVIDK